MQSVIWSIDKSSDLWHPCNVPHTIGGARWDPFTDRPAILPGKRSTKNPSEISRRVSPDCSGFLLAAGAPPSKEARHERSDLVRIAYSRRRRPSPGHDASSYGQTVVSRDALEDRKIIAVNPAVAARASDREEGTCTEARRPGSHPTTPGRI